MTSKELDTGEDVARHGTVQTFGTAALPLAVRAWQRLVPAEPATQSATCAAGDVSSQCVDTLRRSVNNTAGAVDCPGPAARSALVRPRWHRHDGESVESFL